MKKVMLFLAVVLALCLPAVAQTQDADKPLDTFEATRIPANSKVYIKPMDGFESYLAAALRKKSVPLLIVDEPEFADFVITGNSETKKAGWAKTIFGSGKSEESASISVVNVRTKVVVYADSSHRSDAMRGKRSTAEKLAKYLGKKIKDDDKQAMKLGEAGRAKTVSN